MKLFFTFLLTIGTAFYGFSATLSTGPSLGDCDTILTVEGKIYLCHILRQDNREVQFSFCNDPAGKVYVIPNQRISKVSTGNLESSAQAIAPKEHLEVSPQKTTKQIKAKISKRKPTADEVATGALGQGIASIILTASIIFMPFAFFIGAFTIKKGQRALNMIKGNDAKARRARRRAGWAMMLGGLSMVLSLGFVLWMFIEVSKMDFGFGDFSNMGSGLNFSM